MTKVSRTLAKKKITKYIVNILKNSGEYPFSGPDIGKGESKYYLDLVEEILLDGVYILNADEFEDLLTFTTGDEL